MMTKPEIAALVKKSKENDEKAFERLYNEFKGKVYFFALRYVKNETAAEDLTSETFMTALEKLSGDEQLSLADFINSMKADKKSKSEK